MCELLHGSVQIGHVNLPGISHSSPEINFKTELLKSYKIAHMYRCTVCICKQSAENCDINNT
jgi:hypothetical protein